jgi:hypothetical protein
VEFMEKSLGLWAGALGGRPVVPPKAVRYAALKHLQTILSEASACLPAPSVLLTRHHSHPSPELVPGAVPNRP